MTGSKEGCVESLSVSRLPCCGRSLSGTYSGTYSGLALTLAEMAIGGRTGLTTDLSAVPTTTALDAHTTAFSESNSRYVLEVTPQNLASVTNTLAGIPHAIIGQTGGDTVTLTDGDAVYLSVPVSDCVKAHQTPAL